MNKTVKHLINGDFEVRDDLPLLDGFDDNLDLLDLGDLTEEFKGVTNGTL